MVQLHGHLSFSFEKLGLLVGLSDATPLDLVLQLKVLLVLGTLLSENFLDLGIAHILLVLEILDAGIGN